MTPSELRYQVSRRWMEAEILAGRPVQNRRQTISIDLSSLGPDLAGRVEAVADGVLFPALGDERGRPFVLDSGIDPDRSYKASDGELIPMDDPVIETVGELPELSEPTEDIEAVVSAWEGWRSRYCAEALDVINRLNEDQPEGKTGKPFEKEIRWRATRVKFPVGPEGKIKTEDGAAAVRCARAAWAWKRAAKSRFSSESVSAAEEATTPSVMQIETWLRDLSAEELAKRFLGWAKRMYGAAKAHNGAREDNEFDFDAEMRRWAADRGSERLRLGIEDGYRMNARYLTERLAVEAPGFYALSASAVKETWARRTASPSEPALRLRRRVDAAMKRSAPKNLGGEPKVEILTVFEPPPQMYFAHESTDLFGNTSISDFPSKEGWPWFLDEDGNAFGYDAKAFEAVVVREWLGRFHLIGAVANETGARPPGIWAVPELDCFDGDGAVDPQDPDAPPAIAAKRKPPRPEEADDIPF